MHIPYKEVFKRQVDFRVSYRIYTQEEGGRYSLTYQGIRFNFEYKHPEHKKGHLFMIYPEFEDSEGNVIVETDVPVAEIGTARMWILNEDLINYHKGKIKIGTLGYFMEGFKKVGECEVIELLTLKD